MSTDAERFICLFDELQASRKLIEAGFGSLQDIDTANDFYHLPHQLLASGLERLMKCYISIAYEDATGSFPDMTYMRALGHDLTTLLSKMTTEFWGGQSRELVRADFAFVTTDQTLAECVRILSLFGRFGRYYNLDVVAGSTYSPVDPSSEWETLESSIEDISPYLSDMEKLHYEYYPRVHSKIIAKLERLVRAIAFQFTIGDHPDTRGRLSQTSSVYTSFRGIWDESLGTKDYRDSRYLRQQRGESTWKKRTEEEIAAEAWPYEKVTRSGFTGDWPFHADSVTIQLRDSISCVVYVQDYAFALNGMAKSHLNLPDPYDAGVAILGRSIAQLIDRARRLGEATG